MSNPISYRRESISGSELLYPVLALWALSLENAFSGKTDVGENLLVRRDSISRAVGWNPLEPCGTPEDSTGGFRGTQPHYMVRGTGCLVARN